MSALPRGPIDQGTLFQRVRWQMLRNAGALVLGQSRLRVYSIVASCALVAGLMFAGAYEGFALIRRTNLPPSGGIMQLIFEAMFFVLGGMLVFSTGLILYASLFTGAECRYLLTTPARADRIFATRLQGAVAFSSWGFLVLGGPILIAYGMVFDVPAHYYALLPAWLVGYVILAGAAGAIACFLFVNFFPRRRKQAFFFLLGVLAIGVVWWLYTLLELARSQRGTNDRQTLTQIFDLFSLATSVLSPSRWVAEGLMAQAKSEFSGALLWLALVWSNALFFYLTAAFLAKKLYRRGYNRISAEGADRKVYGTHWLDRVMEMLVSYLDPRTRLLVVKDFRTFRREPVQVGQLGLFAGLMLLCVINVRQFFGADLPAVNQAVVSLLNFTATGLLMCAFLGRFVYPLISLEGRKFWVLGLLPLKRDQLLWGKFAFAATLSFTLASGMILMSDLVLGLSWQGVVLHQAAIAVLALGLSGLAVGFSAWMPNFRETDPSKIVVGFGGLLFTLVSLVYLAVTVAVMLAPFHVMTGKGLLAASGAGLPWWVFVGTPIGAVMAVMAVWLPMRAGVRTLRAMEF